MKKAYLLLEVILSITLFFIVTISILKIWTNIEQKYDYSYKTALEMIEIDSAYFLVYNLLNASTEYKLEFKTLNIIANNQTFKVYCIDNNLNLNNKTLLSNLKTCEINNTPNSIVISISTNSMYKKLIF